MTDPAPTHAYPSVEGLRIPIDEQATIQCRFIRGLENPQPGKADLVIAGDTLVSLHVDTNPAFADALADQMDAGDPVIRFDGVTLPQANGLVPVYALSRPRAKLIAGEEVNLLTAAWLAEEQLADWQQLRHQACEVQITIDPSARSTKRTTIQFSWLRADALG